MVKLIKVCFIFLMKLIFSAHSIQTGSRVALQVYGDFSFMVLFLTYLFYLGHDGTFLLSYQCDDLKPNMSAPTQPVHMQFG